MHVKSGQDVLQGSQFQEQSAVLEGAANAHHRNIVRRQAVNRLTLELHAAVGCRHVAGDGVKKRRFSGSVRPDNGTYLASVGVEGHIGERPKAGKVD